MYCTCTQLLFGQSQGGDLFKNMCGLSVQKALREIINPRWPIPCLLHPDVGPAGKLKRPAKFCKDGSFSQEPMSFFGTLDSNIHHSISSLNISQKRNRCSTKFIVGFPTGSEQVYRHDSGGDFHTGVEFSGGGSVGLCLRSPRWDCITVLYTWD